MATKKEQDEMMRKLTRKSFVEVEPMYRKWLAVNVNCGRGSFKRFKVIANEFLMSNGWSFAEYDAADRLNNYVRDTI